MPGMTRFNLYITHPELLRLSITIVMICELILSSEISVYKISYFISYLINRSSFILQKERIGFKVHIPVVIITHKFSGVFLPRE